MSAPAPDRPLRYLALGDSYTVGEDVDPAQSWPAQLVRVLGAEGIAVDGPRIIATTGWTTDELDAAIDAAQPAHDHDLVSLLIGVNNQYRGRSVEEYAAQFAALLDRAVGFAGGDRARVFVLSIPDWGVTPFAAASDRDTETIATQIDAFNAAAARRCQELGVTFIDITPVSRAHGAQADMIAPDGLHPSARMYTLWTRLALPAVRHLLQRSD
ncbi:SGNH/GDSL hydrolase family protein [Luteimonas qiangzhengi]|uniref:SGNH/GDSL hydrolase family protein n=1 Tax=Luteimonas sp. MJ146 TaxID=3129240 RepID=UPI0031BB6150